MNEPIEVKPDGLRRSAANFDDIADKTKQLLDTLKSSLGGKGDAWGDDKIGSKFADGDKGFKKNRDSTFESLSKVADVFHQNAKNLRDSAAMYEKNEQQGVMVRQQQDRSPSVQTTDTTREVPRNAVAQRDTPRRDVVRDDTVTPEGSAPPGQMPLTSRRPVSSIPGTDPVNLNGGEDAKPAPMAMRPTEGTILEGRKPTSEGSEHPLQTPLAPQRPVSSIPGTDPVNLNGGEVARSAPMAMRHTEGTILEGRKPTPEGSEHPVQTPLAAQRPASSIPGTDPVKAAGVKITRSAAGAPMAMRHTEGPIGDGQKATPTALRHTEGKILDEHKVTPQGSEHALNPGHTEREPHSAPTEPQQKTRFPRMETPARDHHNISKPDRPLEEKPDR